MTVVAPSQADAWVDANSFLANKGSDALLNVGDTSRSLVRFTLPPGIPEGCVVESARLRLYADSGTEGTRVEALGVALPWSESAVTWSTQPPVLGPAVAAWSRDGYMQWNVTSLVPAMLAGANNGFLLRDAGEGTESAGGHGFYAREKGDNPPQLVIRFAAPPSGEPAPPAPPKPAAVECGQLVTESTLVTNDLTGCPGDGLLIGADRIVLDLGGHTIDGVGLGTGVRNEGYGSVTVRNGTVQEFDRGVELLEETRRNVITGLDLHHNELAAIELFDTRGNEIRGNTVESNGGGILLTSGTRGTLVGDNSLTLNSGAALLLRDADGNRLEGNRVVGGGDLGVGLERSSGNVLVATVVSDTSDGGIEIQDGSHSNRVEDSTVTQAGDTGILVDASDGNELVGNRTAGMSDSGITLNGANDGLVRGNELGGNPGGLQIDGSRRNLIEGNDASGGSGIGIELGGDSYGNTVLRNTANANSAQGIYVADEALLEPGNLLHRNTANDNGSDGITVAKGGHTLTANLTSGNRGWGINTVGINFAARNMAAGNLEPRQCLGISCALPDATPPETTIGSGPDAITSSSTATFALVANEEFTTFVCSLDGAAFEPCESPAEYTDLAEGAHELQVRATDESGNVERNPATFAWTVDTTPPETAIASGPEPVSEATTARFTFTADELATFECSLDDADFTPCSSPAEYTDLAEGDHELWVRAGDGAGNIDPTPAVRAWSVRTVRDTTAPETTIDAAETTDDRTTFAFSADEPSRFECALDEAAFTDCESPAAYTSLALGEHRFQVRAADATGNTDPTPATHTWTARDTTPPETTIDSGPDDETGDSSATFTFSADEPGSTFECALDANGYQPCDSPARYVDLAPGTHQLLVRATDAAGNTDPVPAGHSWRVTEPDTTPPQTTIVSGPGEVGSDGTALLRFSADEPATFECALDGGPFAACASPAEYADLGVGDHRFDVRATDAAGNSDPTPATHAWRVIEPADVTPPNTALDGAPRSETADREATFTFSADEPATFECALDGAAFSACGSPAVYRDLSTGAHRFLVRATDAAGNTDATPASHAWTVLAPPPTCTATAALVPATADSWILETSPTSNYGSDSNLKIDTKAAANARALVRFALPPLAPGCRVRGARLRLYVGSPKPGRTLEALPAGSAWLERGVTWANRPAASGAAATAVVGSRPGYLEWAVAEQVAGMYAGANHGFVLRDQAEGGSGIEQTLHSREKGTDNPPQLVISFG